MMAFSVFVSSLPPNWHPRVGASWTATDVRKVLWESECLLIENPATGLHQMD